jgi:hypothetical protein
VEELRELAPVPTIPKPPRIPAGMDKDKAAHMLFAAYVAAVAQTFGEKAAVRYRVQARRLQRPSTPREKALLTTLRKAALWVQERGWQPSGWTWWAFRLWETVSGASAPPPPGWIWGAGLMAKHTAAYEGCAGDSPWGNSMPVVAVGIQEHAQLQQSLTRVLWAYRRGAVELPQALRAVKALRPLAVQAHGAAEEAWAERRRRLASWEWAW